MNRISRRDFLKKASASGIGIGIDALFGCWVDVASAQMVRPNAKRRGKMFEVGEGVVDITPPLGIELAGFHRAQGNERVITGIRQSPNIRALTLRLKDVQAAIVSLDICGVSLDFTKRVQNQVEKQVGIPAGNVRICATHTHSMPTFRYFRQWGAVSEEYMGSVEERIVQAVELAEKDLAPADMYAGKARVVNGNFNRTSETWKTDEEFTEESTDDERWLDTMLHVLHFRRGESKQDLLWYHFSAHPVCYTDENAGPDWPGLVAERVKVKDELAPSFLQGHCGDVNPGGGAPWLGEPEDTAEAICMALRHAIEQANPVKVDDIRLISMDVEVPLDIALLKEQLAQYREDPSKCAGGEWVDAGFAEDWFESASKWDLQKTSYPAPISAMKLGEVGFLFHPAELYSYYGLDVRCDSPFDNTLVVAYTDDFIGYLPDPNAYEAKEYAAVVVPKICDLPAFTPAAAQVLTAAAKELLQRAV